MTWHTITDVQTGEYNENRIICDEKPTGITIMFNGKNNVVELKGSSIFNNFTIKFTGNNSRFVLGAGAKISGTADLNEATEICIGDQFTVTGWIYFLAEKETPIHIGNDCMLATDISLRTGDHHAIFDITTKEKINKPRPITIGNHVWISTEAVLLKGANVGDGSVVGYRSVVTGEVPPYSIVVGIPARVVKTNIGWHRKNLDEFPSLDSMGYRIDCEI